jgi:hypothetical protein
MLTEHLFIALLPCIHQPRNWPIAAEALLKSAQDKGRATSTGILIPF